MTVPNTRIHGGLPSVLTLTKRGTPRASLPPLAKLSAADVAAISAVRDGLLELYFPPSHRNSFAEVPYGLGVSSGDVFTFTAGGDGKFGKHPYLLVGEDRRRRYGRAWTKSLQLWMHHLTGGDSVFANWSDEELLTCILLDIDVADPTIHDHLDDATVPWSDAVEALERMADVELHAELMLSGGKGIWLQAFLARPVTRQVAAELALCLAHVVAGRGHRVHVAKHVLGLTGAADDWDEPFCPKSRAEFILDVGNLAGKNCRLPFARHQTSGRFAEFVDADGVPHDDQVAHLMGIERTQANIADVVEASMPIEVAMAKSRRGQREAFEAMAAPQAGKGADEGHERGEDGEGGGGTSKVTSEPSDATSEPDTARVRKPQWVRKVSSLIGGDVGDVPLGSIIGTLEDGNTNIRLIMDGVLDRVYAWFRLHRGGDFTVEDVLGALRPHYVAKDDGSGGGPVWIDKTEEVRRVVEHDFRTGRHLTTNPDRWSHPCVARCRRAAAAAGLDEGSRQFLVLVYLAYKAWRHDCVATATALEIAKSLELVEMDCVEHKASQVKVGRDLKELEGLGLIERTGWGWPGRHSTFEIRFPLRADDGEEDGDDVVALDPAADADDSLFR